MGGSIHIGENQLEIRKLSVLIDMIETPGGHYVIPLKQVAVTELPEEVKDTAKDYHENIVGEEADAIMIILMLESEDEESLQILHDRGRTLCICVISFN